MYTWVFVIFGLFVFFLFFWGVCLCFLTICQLNLCWCVIYSFLEQRAYHLNVHYCSFVSKNIEKAKWVVQAFHFAWLCFHFIYLFIYFYISPPSDRNRVELNIFSFFSDFLFFFQFKMRVMITASAQCHNLHELLGLWWDILTLDSVFHASIIRICVSIDICFSTCLSVWWNKTNVIQCTHSNLVKCADHLCIDTYMTIRYLSSQVRWIFSCT